MSAARSLAAVLVLCAVLLFVGLGHGLPQRYVPDDSAVKCALGIAHDAAAGDVALLPALVPPAGQYTTYPYLLPYLDLAAIGVRFAAGRVAGEWGGPGEFAERVFEDASVAWLPARVVSALLALLVPLGTWWAARELGRPVRERALAALLAGSSLLVVQYGHTERPWAPLVGLAALALAASLRLQRRQDTGAVALASVAAGLCAASHPVGLGSFGLVALAARLFGVRWAGLAAGLLPGVVVALLVGYPYLLVYGIEAGSGAIAGAESDAIEIGGQPFDATVIGGALLVPTALSWLGYEPVLLIAGVLGLARLRRALPPRAWGLLVAPALLYTLLFLLYDGTHVRYLMPLAPVLALGAAALLARLAAGTRPARLFALVLVALPVVQACRLDQLLRRNDTRSEAAVLLPSRLQPRDIVAVDHVRSYYGPPVPATSASLARVETLVGLTREERRQLERADAGLPDPPGAVDVVPVSRFYLFDSYYATDHVAGPPLPIQDFMARHGVSIYVQVDRAPDDARRQPISDLLAARGTLLFEITPTGSSPPSIAALPTDLSFALTQLWELERPGPWVRVWRLRP